MSKFKVGDEVCLRNLCALRARVILVDVPYPVQAFVRAAEMPVTSQMTLAGKKLIGVELDLMDHSWSPPIGADVGYRPNGNMIRTSLLVPEDQVDHLPCPTCGRMR